MNHDHTEESPLEIIPPSALESITRGEVDMQVATAHRYPRSMAQFKKRAIDMATLDEETAESCIYCRPVGMKDGKQQYAEGMSIRMAEIVGASYGNIRVGAMIIEQTPRMVKCRGMAHDLEANFMSTSECIETTVTKKGDPFSENMRAVVAKACLAKAWRDALFKVVPRALCKPIESKVRELIVGDAKSLESRRAAVMQWVNKLGIDVTRVFAALGIVGEEDIGSDHLMLLTGLKSALKEGDTTIEDAFPPIGANPDGAPKFVPKPKHETPKAEAPKTATAQDPLPKPQEINPVKTGDHAKRGYSATNTPQEPASKPAVAESTETAPKSENPAQQPAAPTGWREFVIPGRSPDWSGKTLGSLTPAQLKQCSDEYVALIEVARATAPQKMLKAQMALAMAELFPSTPQPDLPDKANSTHLKEMLDTLAMKKWDPGFFLTTCKLNAWVEESHRRVEEITEQEWEGLKEGWSTVEEEMAKAHQPAQQP